MCQLHLHDNLGVDDGCVHIVGRPMDLHLQQKECLASEVGKKVNTSSNHLVT